MGRKIKKRDKEVSSGTRHQAQARQQICRLRMKVARWKKNQSNPQKIPTWTKDQNVRKRSRHNQWNTSKMEAHIKKLEKIVATGAKRP